MDVILKFYRINYEKYDTSRINIENGISFPEEVKVLKINKTKYDYQEAVVQLVHPDDGILGDKDKQIFKRRRYTSNKNCIL